MAFSIYAGMRTIKIKPDDHVKLSKHTKNDGTKKVIYQFNHLKKPLIHISSLSSIK